MLDFSVEDSSVLEISLAISLSLLAIIYIVKFIYELSYQRNSVAEAEISRISPFFRQRDSLKTHWLHCSYDFYVTSRHYRSFCILPLNYFLDGPIPTHAVILNDVRLELPVFICDGVRLVGEESIEHFLLQRNSHIPIKYRVRDPQRSHPLELESMERFRVKNGRQDFQN